MGTYSGIIKTDNGVPTLHANGLIMQLEADPAVFIPHQGNFISVSGEQDGGTIRNALPLPAAETPANAPADPGINLQPVIAAIKPVYDSLMSIPGVISVRPGFSEKDFSVTQPVIVVITDPAQPAGTIPAEINGFAAEIRTASAQELVEGFLPFSAWEDEKTEEAAPKINYVPPDPSVVSLKKMDVSGITCHVGPDSGWSTLKPFLEGTVQSLTVAMFEFYATHILDTMVKLGEETDAALDMILEVDKNDKECEKKLRAAWGDRLRFVPAAVSGVNRVFNNSYHTKVAVRDSKAVWVSSGNWSPHSQPVIKSGTENTLYRTGNREWHVIIKDKKAADMYEKFIRYDMEMATAAHTADETEETAPAMPDLLVPESLFEPEAAVLQDHPFVSQTFATDGEKITIQPLMSPDNYATGILKFIRSAKKSLYLQFSYINKPSSDLFEEIIEAVALKMKEGLDVRVIAGTSQKREHIDFLIGKRNWKRKMFRIQKTRLHNKGVIVDGKAAVVGSNNWSTDGLQYNRDTSIIFYSRPIAQYFTEVFLFDWDNLTRDAIAAPETTPVLAPESGPTPPGMVRIPWSHWFNE